MPQNRRLFCDSLAQVPTTEDQRPPQKEAIRMYYFASLARALSAARFGRPWRQKLRGRLRGAQREDGSWVGWSNLMKEDDPLVATSLVVMG